MFTQSLLLTLWSELNAVQIGAVACRYVDAVMQDVGNPASLKPPIPPLTRYKRDVVTKLQTQDSEASFRPGSTRPASMLHTKCAQASLPYTLS